MENKMSKKKIAGLCILGAVILAALVAVLIYIFKPDKGLEVETVTPEYKDIIETYDTSGVVCSDSVGKFDLLAGVRVTRVNVKVGDVVKKGDVLVQFDASSLKTVLSEREEEFNKAKTAYNEYLQEINAAKSSYSSNLAQIAQTQKLVEQLEKQFNLEKQEQIKQAIAETQQAQKDLEALTEDKSLAKKIIDFFSGSDNTMSQLNKYLEESKKYGAEADISDLLASMDPESTQYKLAEAELKLASLKMENMTLQAQSKGTFLSAYKSVYDYALKSYNTAKETVSGLEKGWTAAKPGVISAVNVVAGEVYSSKNSTATQTNTSELLASISSGDTSEIKNTVAGLILGSETGLEIQYYPFSAKFLIGQTDLKKVSVGQEVNVKTATGDETKGRVTYIGAVATKEVDGGLSSLLNSGTVTTGIDAKIEIENPTNGVMVGLSVDISVNIKESKHALSIPVEAIQYDNEKPYVFVIENKMLKKNPIETGLFDGSRYEVKSGLSENSKFVKAPTASMAEGAKAYEK